LARLSLLSAVVSSRIDAFVKKGSTKYHRFWSVPVQAITSLPKRRLG